MENNFSIKAILNPNFNAEKFPCEEMISEEIMASVKNFHRSLPGYKPTITHSLNELSVKLKLSDIYIKDESTRFDLKAFKVLGASYAMASILAEFLGLKGINFDQIIANKNLYKHLVFATTTDGNHGRAVAWAAQKFGCKAIVYMPKGSSQNRLNAIRFYGAEAHISDMGYDDCVQAVSELAAENKWLLIQDSSWDGYESIPSKIMQGYFSLITEFIDQFPTKDSWPTHVFVQAGVGTLAAAVALAFRFIEPESMPKIIVVEPIKAACFYESIEINDGLPHRYSGELDTMMAGLACGEPAKQAWLILSKLASAFVICEDEISFKGMRFLASRSSNDQNFISGESAAVGLGVISEVMKHSVYKNIRDDLRLNSDSKVLLFSTEGDTDSDIYQAVMNKYPQ